MAFTMSADAQLTFFEKVFGINHEVTERVKFLLTEGWVFKVAGMYTLTAERLYVTKQCPLSKGVNTLMKQGPYTSDLASKANKDMIAAWVNGLSPTKVAAPEPAKLPSAVVYTGFKEGMKIGAIKAVRTVLTLGLKEAKDFVEVVEHGVHSGIVVHIGTAVQCQKIADTLHLNGAKSQVLVDFDITAYSFPVAGTASYLPAFNAAAFLGFPVSNEPTTGSFTSGPASVTPTTPPAYMEMTPVALRDAKTVGQPVTGTSAGSVYYCVAINDRVRIAARIMASGAISIRAEWDKATPEEMQALNASGLSVKGDYASTHLDAGEIPAARIIGAYVMGMGIEWQQLISTKHLVVNK